MRDNLNILFVWTGVTSYMADCWRELASRDGVSLKIVIEEKHANRNTSFDNDAVLHGLDCSIVYDDNASETPFTALDACGWMPGVMVVGGWRAKTSHIAVECPEWADVRKVFALDMPWEWKFRKIAARIALWRYMRHFKKIWVPGANAARYARWLGFRDEDIVDGLYAVSPRRFRPRVDRQKGFLYVGRLVPEKRLDVLVGAFARYRAMGGKWNLDIYGEGPVDPMSFTTAEMRGSRCISIHGFAQADAMPGIYRGHGCLVLPSDFDPWPLVILEASLSGLDVICSDRCGNAGELGVGHVCRCGDETSFSSAMMEVEVEGKTTGNKVPEKYICDLWAKKVLGFFGDET